MDLYMGTVKALLKTTNLTEFEKNVLIEISRTKPGETITYAELARRIGCPNAARAVGNALHINPFPVFIPCHRVVGCNSLGGYGMGLPIKRTLLAG